MAPLCDMSDAIANHDRANLRQDLTSIQVEGSVRPYRIVIDEIGGRFARVSEHVWQRLIRGGGDANLWADAMAAGWLRNRARTPEARFTPLAIRFPLGSIDFIAKTLARFSGMIFSPIAILCWSLVMIVTFLAVASRSDQWLASIGSLPAYLQRTGPITIAILFVFTKTVHELGHAVMCRRLGSRPGDVGILLLCGMPCPYCDVTDIWRQPSMTRRAAVMLAGIYVELIVAAIAAIVWMSARDPATQLAALNVLLICSVSTIVFNANPLMRYDGYYVLADLVGSPNLRHEAQIAFRSVVTRRLAGTGIAVRKRSDVRALLLSAFHACSKLYRLLILVAIAALVIEYADWIGLKTAAMALVAVAAMLELSRSIRNIAKVMIGRGVWQSVSVWRRIIPVGSLLIMLLALVVVPLPRHHRATGVIDAADAQSVFIPETGLVQNVNAEFGQSVGRGETLVQLDRSGLMVRQARMKGELRLAKSRSNLSRRTALQHSFTTGSNSAVQWKTLRAAEDAAHTQLVSLQRRIDATNVRSPADGIVIPASPALARSQQQQQSPTYLEARTGSAFDAGYAWCRVSSGGRLQAVLLLDARERANVHTGSTVMVRPTHSPDQILEAEVISVSAIRQIDSHIPDSSAFQVLCSLHEVPDEELLYWVGQECRGVFRLPSRTIAGTLTSWLESWFRE